MDIGQLEQQKQIAVRNVIMQEKIVEQAKADVAHFEGRLAERKEMQAEAKLAKKAYKKTPHAKK